MLLSIERNVARKLRATVASRRAKAVVGLRRVLAASSPGSPAGSALAWSARRHAATSGLEKRLLDSAALLREAAQVALASGPKGVARATDTARIVAGVSLEQVLGPPLAPPALLRKIFERLGPTYIKLGQFVASSPSLFPADYVVEFQGCLDQTLPVPFEELREVLKEELGSLDDKFEYIEHTPLASASIAQVHAARLKGTGAEVCLKIQKPGVAEVLQTDLSFVYLGARFLELISPDLSRASLGDIVRDIRTSMMEEVDFLAEANNIRHFTEFLQCQCIDRVTAPVVYRDLTTRKVLTMERFHGVHLTDLDAIRGRIDETPEEVLLMTLNTWFATVLGCQSFHADVHAGNLMVLRDGRVGFIDFGIVGKIRPSTWGAVRAFLGAVHSFDFDGMASALAMMGATDVEVDVSALAEDLRLLFSTLAQMEAEVVEASKVGQNVRPLGAGMHASVMVDQIEVNRLMIDLARLGERHGLRLPREFGMLLKQLLYFDRYSKLLAPDVDMVRDRRLTVLRQTRYAFAFDGPRGVAEPRSGEAEVALTPLDALYLARLCALDDGQQQLFQQDASGAGEATATCPPHLLTSDEVLVALLQDTEGFSEPDIRGRTGESARDVVIEAGAAVVEVASTIAGERADSCTAEGDR